MSLSTYLYRKLIIVSIIPMVLLKEGHRRGRSTSLRTDTNESVIEGGGPGERRGSRVVSGPLLDLEPQDVTFYTLK